MHAGAARGVNGKPRASTARLSWRSVKQECWTTLRNAGERPAETQGRGGPESSAFSILFQVLKT